MYYVRKTLEISACHQLYLDYESKCENLHGHNWKINVYCRSEKLDSNGMVCDFTEIKRFISVKSHTIPLLSSFSARQYTLIFQLWPCRFSHLLS